MAKGGRTFSPVFNRLLQKSAPRRRAAHASGTSAARASASRSVMRRDGKTFPARATPYQDGTTTPTGDGSEPLMS